MTYYRVTYWLEDLEQGLEHQQIFDLRDLGIQTGIEIKKLLEVVEFIGSRNNNHTVVSSDNNIYE